jgi:hypothetical protein
MARQMLKNRAKRWQARRKRDGSDYFLGYFLTQAEAEDAERAFDRSWPPKVFNKPAYRR